MSLLRWPVRSDGRTRQSRRFICFEAGDLTIYVAREFLEKLETGVQQMPFYIDGYGRFWLVFAEPWGDG